MDYLRDDIYYCDCCAQFYDIKTDDLVEVNLSDYLEADPVFIRQVMADREKIANSKKKPHHSNSRKRTPRVYKGFNKPK